MGKYRVRKIGERAFMTLLVAVVLVLGCGMTAMAEYQSKDGVTMYYYLTLSGNTWNAQTYCYEDMGSMVSLFIYKTKGGTLLQSDCKKVHNRTIVPGTSATRTYAELSFKNSSATYGRSEHALLWINTNVPYISALELIKSK